MFYRIKSAIKVILGKAKAVPLKSLNSGSNFFCPVCQRGNVQFKRLPFDYLRELDKHQYIHSIFQVETLNIEYYSCTECGASDRDRLYALYFQKRLRDTSNKLFYVLDIAPTVAMNRFLKACGSLSVRTADLYMQGVDDKVDLTRMDIYPDERFDVFVCSHVLEHIHDDVAAMKELHRVLKTGGWGIVMVPINLGLKEIYEDNTITDKAGRWRHFGQDDHLRMYSKEGFIGRLKSVGFTVQQYGISWFGSDVFDRHGIHPRSVLYIVTK